MVTFTPDIIGLFLLLGSLAGFLAGLLGIGGGIILIPLFLWSFQSIGLAPEVIVHLALGTSLAIIIPTAISSTLGHRRRGNVAWQAIGWMAAGGVVGVCLGSTLAASLSGTLLRGLFGLMQIGVGLKMYFHPRLPPEENENPQPSRLLLVGAAVGSFSSFFGVGGGIIAVPMMVILLRFPIHLAVGSSSGLMMVSSLLGTAAYIFHGWQIALLPPYSWGYVNWLVAVIIAPLTIVFARYGVRAASRLPQNKLMKIFAAFVILVGVEMLVQIF
jgi:uncharacterized membrane protein YfcA